MWKEAVVTNVTHLGEDSLVCVGCVLHAQCEQKGACQGTDRLADRREISRTVHRGVGGGGG
jgi:hypothetical protein